MVGYCNVRHTVREEGKMQIRGFHLFIGGRAIKKISNSID